MKIFQIISGIRKESGGPSYTVPSLCSQLVNQGCDIELNLLDVDPETNYNFKIVTHTKIHPYKLGISPAMKKYLEKNVCQGDVLHTHGVWMMPNIYPLEISKTCNAKLVLSPRGMLSSWSLNQRKLIKKIIGYVWQNDVIMKADCLHATAESEYDDIRSYGYKGPIAIIPNGVDISVGGEFSINAKKRVIFISRIHPKKGIEMLIQAWTNIHADFNDWELVICGPGEPNYLENIINTINDKKEFRISYMQPVYNDEKTKFYKSGNIFVLPTHNENFGVVVAEALANGLPCIVTKGAPWSGLEKNNCGWWIDNSLVALESALRNAMSTPIDQLLLMGKNGSNWIATDFSWCSIGKKMALTYDWLNNLADKPDYVFLD